MLHKAMRSRTKQSFQKLRGALRPCNLQPYGAAVWLYYQYKSEESTALPFRVHRLSGSSEELARGCELPPKAIWEGHPFSRLREQAR